MYSVLYVCTVYMNLTMLNIEYLYAQYVRMYVCMNLNYMKFHKTQVYVFVLGLGCPY